ncbi:AAA family ATPase [Olivibacter sitiensis]|uniref:AAA family ATPase n=1 Tax=Olivibacter sitiensis TaxID=376470 RepID=UPI0004133231|nr:SbcC/MukB-like Walker B domain-containing protein [Olivibacter sitiensis]
MIPISLKIKGLYSYQGEQVILFDRLIEAQLFGIFGTVGSGKSSILEAIAYALYGDTERLNRADSRNYNMMNLKSDELLIDFVFENHDGRQYRFVVQGKRNRKNFDDVKTFVRSAYRKVEQQWLPLEHTTAEQLLGLSYENFRRTIIIPQGKFQEFLQLSDKARTDMLKEIFQLDRFEFFQQTASLERKNNEKVHQLKGRLVAFTEIDEERLEMQRKSLAEMRLALEKLQAYIEVEEATFKEQERLRQLFEELKAAKSDLEKLNEQAEAFAAMEQQIVDYEYVERNFKVQLLRQDELLDGISRRKEALEKHIQDGKIADTRLMEIQQEYARIHAAYQTLDNLKLKQADLEGALRIHTVETSLNTLNERVSKGLQVVHDKKQEQEELKQNLTTIQESVQQIQAKMPDMQQLSALQAWYGKKAFLDEKRQQQVRECSTIEGKIALATSNYETFLQKVKLHNEDDVPMRIRQLWEESELKAKQLQQQFMHDQLQLRLGEFASALQAGEPCPLCGAIDHPHVLEVSDVKGHLQDKEAQLAEIRKRQEELMQWEQSLQLLLQERRQLEEQLQASQGRVQEIDEEQKAHLATFHWQRYQPNDNGVVEAALKTAQSLKHELENLDKDRSEKEKKLHEVENEIARFEQALHKFIAEQGAKQGELATLKGQIKVLSKEEMQQGKDELHDMLAHTTETISQVSSQYEQIQILLVEQQRLKATLAERIASVEDNIKAESERMAVVQEQLQEALSNSYFSSLEEVRAILKKAIALDEMRKKLEQHKQQLFSAQGKLLHLEQQVEGRRFDAETFEELKNRLIEARRRLQEQNDSYVAEKTGYERHVHMLEEKTGLLRELEVLERRTANLGVLKNLFKGSGFVSYISSVYLQQLCDAANKRFHKLTRQQLQLEVTDKNEFQVRDFLNDGKVRLAKTLSGGQTFQASLSLALALAESVQQQNKAKQNFFFLDEGFGSLDKESLAVAFDTLKSLRKENRIVGIISHVEELQQEIDVYLHVVNDADKGTRVKGNWE